MTKQDDTCNLSVLSLIDEECILEKIIQLMFSSFFVGSIFGNTAWDVILQHLVQDEKIDASFPK